MSAIYQAGPLFTEAERAWHKNLSAHLRVAGHTVVWPGDLLTAEKIQSAGAAGPAWIFRVCLDALDHCDCLVAVLDGPQVDDGTAWEMGYAYARGLPVYGLRTDFRQAGETQYSRVTAMIGGCLVRMAANIPGLLRCLAIV